MMGTLLNLLLPGFENELLRLSSEPEDSWPESHLVWRTWRGTEIEILNQSSIFDSKLLTFDIAEINVVGYVSWLVVKSIFLCDLFSDWNMCDWEWFRLNNYRWFLDYQLRPCTFFVVRTVTWFTRWLGERCVFGFTWAIHEISGIDLMNHLMSVASFPYSLLILVGPRSFHQTLILTSLRSWLTASFTWSRSKWKKMILSGS